MVSTRGQSRRTELFWAAMRVIREVEQEFFRQLRVNRLKAAYYLRRRITLWPGWGFFLGVSYTPSGVAYNRYTQPTLLPGGGDAPDAPSLDAVLGARYAPGY